jgi:alcohol dehydrogenase
VESAVCKRRSEISTANSRAAFALLANAFPKILADPGDVEARAAMLLGAALSGVAIENSMLGAAHSAANPLTAHFGTVHGEAVGMMLPHVVHYNSADANAASAYRYLAASAGAADLAAFLTTLLASADLSLKMPAQTLSPENIPGNAEEAAGQWTAQFNPVPVNAPNFAKLYAVVM